MTSVQPRTKVSEIIKELSPYLKGDKIATEFTLRRFKQVAVEGMVADASESYAALGMLATLSWDEEMVDSNFSNAIRLDNDYTVHMNYATCLQILGRFLDAASQVKQACDIAPTDFLALRRGITLSVMGGDIETATLLRDRLARLGPNQDFAELELMEKLSKVLDAGKCSLQVIRDCNTIALELLRENKMWSNSLHSEVDLEDRIIFFTLGVKGTAEEIEQLDVELGTRLFDRVPEFNPSRYWVGFEKVIQE